MNSVLSTCYISLDTFILQIDNTHIYLNCLPFDGIRVYRITDHRHNTKEKKKPVVFQLCSCKYVFDLLSSSKFPSENIVKPKKNKELKLLSISLCSAKLKVRPRQERIRWIFFVFSVQFFRAA